MPEPDQAPAAVASGSAEMAFADATPASSHDANVAADPSPSTYDFSPPPPPPSSDRPVAWRRNIADVPEPATPRSRPAVSQPSLPRPRTRPWGGFIFAAILLVVPAATLFLNARAYTAPSSPQTNLAIGTRATSLHADASLLTPTAPLQAGASAHLLSRSGDAALVELPDRQRGWVHRASLCTIDEWHRRSLSSGIPANPIRITWSDGAFRALSGDQPQGNTLNLAPGQSVWFHPSAAGREFILNSTTLACRPDRIYSRTPTGIAPLPVP